MSSYQYLALEAEHMQVSGAKDPVTANHVANYKKLDKSKRESSLASELSERHTRWLALERSRKAAVPPRPY